MPGLLTVHPEQHFGHAISIEVIPVLGLHHPQPSLGLPFKDHLAQKGGW